MLAGHWPFSSYLLSWRRYTAHRLIKRADQARDLGDFARAASLYRRSLASDPRRADIRVQLGHMLKELTHFSDAEGSYRQALAQIPESGDAWLHLGHLLKLLGRIDDAIAAYRRALDLPGGRETAAAELLALNVFLTDRSLHRADIISAQAYILEGDRLRDSRNYHEAAQAYANALELAPERTDIRVQYGNMLKDVGLLTEAEAAYCLALAQAPEQADTHLQLGRTLKLQGRHAEALESYRRATELQPSLEEAWAELSNAGCPEAQLHRFETQVVHGSVDALLTVAEEVARLQGMVSRLAEILPEMAFQTAFPIAAYDRFRSLFDIPPPPAAAVECSFGIILVIDGQELQLLYEQIASIRAQTYRNWRLLVVGSNAAQRRIVERASASDARIAWVECIKDESIGATERRIACSLAADWLILPARGMRLHRYALGWCAAVFGKGAAVAFVTDGEAQAAPSGVSQRLVPQLRQVVDYDTLLETNPYGDTLIIERLTYLRLADQLVVESLNVAHGFLLLELARRNAVGHIPLPLVVGREQERTDSESYAKVVRIHLAAARLDDRVSVSSSAADKLPCAIAWQPCNPQQLLQVIVPTRDNAIDLREFVLSLRRHADAPEAVRVLVIDNGSRQPETAQILARLASEDWLESAVMDEPFNWSRLNNRAVAMTRSELLLFANDDMLMLSHGWDRHLRGLLDRPEVGGVGVRLIYPNDTLQHAGILLGWPGIDVHDGRYESISTAGPCSRWMVTRAVSAVTGAFLAVRREVFEAVAGFDEAGLPVAYADIDFALKLRARGLKILWTPSITLRHYESKSRGLDHLDHEKEARYQAERKIMEQRWNAALTVDPSFNPMWHTATMPFRLISAPPLSRLWRHIRLCASENPWLPALSSETSFAGADLSLGRPPPYFSGASGK